MCLKARAVRFTSEFLAKGRDVARCFAQCASMYTLEHKQLVFARLQIRAIGAQRTVRSSLAVAIWVPFRVRISLLPCLSSGVEGPVFFCSQIHIYAY